MGFSNDYKSRSQVKRDLNMEAGPENDDFGDEEEDEVDSDDEFEDIEEEDFEEINDPGSKLDRYVTQVLINQLFPTTL
jgi:hypothetical protein